MLIDFKSRFIEMFGDIRSNSKGWKSNELGELGVFKTGGTPSSKFEKFYNGSIPFISTPSLGPNYIDETAAKYLITEEAVNSCATALVPAGSLIIGTRINVGQSSINTVPLCTNQDIVSMMNVKKEYNLLFLKHCIDQYITYLDSQKKGATIKGITTNLLKSIQIPEPPIDQQNQYEAFVKQVDKSKVIFSTTLKSRFIEMFGTMDQPKVPFKQLGDVATYVNGYAFKPSDWGTEGLPIIRIQNLSGSGDSFNYYSDKYPQNIEINKGDIMISWSATLGVFVWNGPKALLNQHIFKVCFDKMDVNPTYFRVAVEPALKISASKVHGSTMTHLTKKTFDAIKIAMPTKDQQNEFAAFVEQVNKSKFKLKNTVKSLTIKIKQISSENC